MNNLDPVDLEIGIWPPVVKIDGKSGMIAGGNALATGIYILHKPTGIGSISTSERSQFANRNVAMKMLEKLLNQQSVESSIAKE